MSCLLQLKKSKAGAQNINSIIKLYLGEQGSGKTAKIHNSFFKALKNEIHSSQIMVIVRNKTLEDLFRKNLLYALEYPVEDLNIFRFRSFVTRIISNYWSYLFKFPPVFLGFSQSIITIREFLKENPKWFGGKYFDTFFITKLFERQQRRAENYLTFQELEKRTKKFIYNEIILEANAFLEKYNHWILDRDVPLLDYAAQLDCFMKLINIDEVQNNIVNKLNYLWLIDDIEDSIPVEQYFYEKFWNKVQNFIYTGNQFGGVREFMGSNPYYINDLKEKATKVVYLERNDNTVNCPYELGKVLYKIFKNKEESINVSVYENIEIHNSLSYGKMLENLREIILNLKNNNISGGKISIICKSIDLQLQLELEYFLKELRWEPETIKSSRALIKNPLINVILTFLRLIFYDEIKVIKSFPQLTSIDFSQLLFITGNIDNYHISKLRRSLGDNTDKWLKFIDDYSKKEGYKTIKSLNDLIIHCRNNKSNLRTPGDYREMAVNIWKTLLWKSNFFVQNKPVNELVIFLNMLENYLFTTHILRGKYLLTEFIFYLLNGEIADNPDRVIDLDSDKIKLFTLQKLTEIKYASDYQVWLDITSDKWMKNEFDPVVNPYILSRGYPEEKEWSLMDEEDIVENNLGKSLRLGLSLCKKKAYFLSSEYNITGELQSNDFLKNVLESTALKKE